MVKKKISTAFSMAGWDLLTYVKGRKRGIIAAVAGVMAYAVSDSELAAVLSGVIVEGMLSIAEFYFKKVDLK